MPSCCASFCTNTTCVKGRGQTFHRFPFSQPHFLEKWVLNMNRDNWTPSKASVLCSDHFEDKCFDRTGQTVRLRLGAIPTRFTYPVHMLKQLKRQQALSTCELPEETFISHSGTNTERESSTAAPTNNCTSPKPSNSPVCYIDHSYSIKENPVALKKDLSAAIDKIDNLQRKLKTSRQKSRRLEKKVTYRWLSQTLSVHVNEAKQMLETYAELQKRKPNPPSIGITYLLSGIQERGNGVKVNKVCVVSDKDLEETEAAMTEVISKHIYSIQKAILKDSNSLYMTDYQIIKDSIRQPNRFSAIQCADAKARTPEELAELGALSGRPTSSATTPAKPKLNGSAEKHVIESLKQEPKKASASQGKKGQITSFGGFAASNGRGSSEKSDRKEQADSSRQKEEQKHTVPSSKAKGGMMAFLNRPSTVKPKAEEKSAVAKQAASTMQQAQEPPRTTKEPEQSPESRREEKRGGKAKRKANRINISDSDSEEERKTAKRRRRIIQQDSSSSSSEEELSDMEDSPIPPTPPPAPAKVNSSDSEEEVAKGSSHVPSETGDAGSAPSLPGSSGKRRRRKRVLKSKTTIDDEGCMVTEKVWESDWTDVSDDEAPPPKKTAPSATAVPQTSPKEGGDKTGEEEADKKKKTSPGSGKTKQRSLMSFFKRK